MPRQETVFLAKVGDRHVVEAGTDRRIFGFYVASQTGGASPSGQPAPFFGAEGPLNRTGRPGPAKAPPPNCFPSPLSLHRYIFQTMPRHESAKKRMRQNEKRQERNKSQKSRVRTKIKKLRSLDEKQEAEELLNDVKGDLDRLAAKGIIHKNKAANRKSTLEKHVNTLG